MSKKTPKKKTKQFIDFLDAYQSSELKNPIDYSLLVTFIENYYTNSELYDTSFVGIRKPYLSTVAEDAAKHTSNSIDNIVVCFFPQFTYYDTAITNPYMLWQQQHETNIMVPHVPRKKVVIDASINTLTDVLHILETTAWSPDTDYNFDLRSLHNIKTELTELNAMIGMETMKQSVLDQLIYFIQDLHIIKNAANERGVSDYKHTVIFGPPGTGKTEVAKIIGRMYSKLGILKNSVFKKVTRNDLIAGYLGQTAIKTKKVIEECIGGVLFIDEAYSLANTDNQDSYSKECLDILCEALSDHKDDLMVIIAGYEDELNETFFRANKGLQSRFIWRFTMEEYNAKELMGIFKKKVAEQGWTVEDIKESWFKERMQNFKHFGRDMELLLTFIKISHGRRVYGKDIALRKQITGEDMQKGYDIFVKNCNSKKKETSFMHDIYV